MTSPHLRVARPASSIPETLRFYRDGLGLEVLARFEDHDGFDGVMLGTPGGAYHLEFTVEHGDASQSAPPEDDLLVFYLPDVVAHEAAVASMSAAGFAPVPSHNPYWDRRGVTFEDPDGYRVVLANSTWES